MRRFFPSSHRRGSNFNPRTPRGVRPLPGGRARLHLPRISIHAPREGCDLRGWGTTSYRTYFNPRTPRGVRLQPGYCARQPADISIHAPREGCDPPWRPLPSGSPDFNPRTPRGVRRHRSSMTRRAFVFQSTHPARGATEDNYKGSLDNLDISIHAPREGCDSYSIDKPVQVAVFQSTHPARGATSGQRTRRPPERNFNPRTPRGVRRRCHAP